MKVQKTLQFKIIQANKHKLLSLNLTMRRYRKCINFYIHEITKGTKLETIYDLSKQQYNLPTGLIQTARDIAKEQLASYKNNDDNPHFPHFNGFTTMRLDYRNISFFQRKKGMFSMFKTWASISTVNGRVKFPINSCKGYLEKLKTDKFLSAQLLYRDGDFYINVIFEEERYIPKEKDFEYIVSVDRGSHNNIANIAVLDIQGNYVESKFFPAGRMLEKRRRYALLRKRLGKKKLLKMIKKTKDKEYNYMWDINQKISTEIIRIAKKYQNPNKPNIVIVLENLKYIRNNKKLKKWNKKNKKLVHSWAFAQLEEMIKYKAHNNSIALRRVYPRGTSSTCKNCGSKVKRSPAIIAVCKTCKKTYNADWLGAVNIGLRYISYMLKYLGDSECPPKQKNDDPKGNAIAPDIFGCSATPSG